MHLGVEVAELIPRHRGTRAISFEPAFHTGQVPIVGLANG